MVWGVNEEEGDKDEEGKSSSENLKERRTLYRLIERGSCCFLCLYWERRAYLYDENEGASGEETQK